MSHYHHHDDASGERFVPELMSGELIDAEHQARYRFALAHASGKRVLDAGCGVGWGSKLLLEAGASSVVGLDISEEALADCRRRAPEVEFVQGDLQDLPFADGEFDLVVCFEALEHAGDTSSVLDHLARVLADDGLLLVSSPNPAVYPEGNEFHLHELTPAELAQGVRGRFPHVQMFLQHQMVASVIAADDPAPDGAFEALTHSVTGWGPGNDAYSVAAGSRQPLPPMTPWTCVAPMTELLRLRDERVVVLDEMESAHQRLRDADIAMREVISQRDEALQRVTDLHTQWEATTLQLDNQRAFASNAAAERDDLAVRLIDAAQRERKVPGPGESIADAQAEIERLRAKLTATRTKLKGARRRAQRLRAERDVARQPASSLGRIKSKLSRSRR